MANPSMSVVDVDLEEKQEDSNAKKQESKADAMTPEDLLWIELLKTLDKLEKGVEGDLSALGRATRNINRFRKRLPSTTWLRILYTIIPTNYREEFTTLLTKFIADLPQQELLLISNLVGVSQADAEQKLKDNNHDVFKTLMDFIAEKEKLAKIEIKKKQEQLKKERLEREKKKGEVVVEEADKKAEDDKMEVDDSKKMEVDTEEADKEKEKGEDSKEDDGNLDEIKITLLPLRDRRQQRKFYPETYILLQLLIALELFDRGQYEASSSILARLIDFSKQQNRRTSDLLSSRLYQFYALCTQRLSVNNQFTASFCQFLYDNYKTACLQQNESGQSVLIVLVLQYYINNHLYSLAHKFVEKAEFPESSESQFFARYHYYRGRIDCVQLQYSNSLYHIQQSMRRAPQTGTYGFKINATRWLIVIQLLMGDIPDRNLFKPRFDGKEENNEELNEALKPFLEITECVREGDLNRYQQCLLRDDALFKQCGVAKILLRLRHNVIKTGLRKINKSYSKISLQDVADKLALASAQNAYFIVSKAIRDGVINASIDYEHKFVESKENVDVYSTSQPYQSYAQRIKFCLEIRNNAVTNLRYPANDDDDEQQNKKKKSQDDDDDIMTAEEIAEMIQKHHEEDDED